MPGISVVAEIDVLPPGVNTLTVYVRRERSIRMSNAISRYGFARVVVNPGSENPELAGRLGEMGVEVLDACTLVMLATGAF